MGRVVKTIDAHAAGAPLRLVREGWPEPAGATMGEKLAFASSRQDKLRAFLMNEPRGHADMSGALLTAPERPGSAHGVIFMHGEGFSAMCGHGLLALGKILGGSRFEVPGSSSALVQGATSLSTSTSTSSFTSYVLDTAVGTVTVRVNGDNVSYIGVPSFVLAGGVAVSVGTRTLVVDVAYGGAFYAMVDAEAAGLAVVPSKLPELRAVGRAIAQAVEKQITLVHPADAEVTGLDGVIFTGPPSSERADIRSVTIFADGAADRSPCGAATCALLAVVDAMGLIDPSRPFVNESIIGTTFSATIADRASIGDVPAIVPEISGTAHITGEHTFVLEKNDPFPQGFRL